MGLKDPYVFAILVQIIQASMTLFTKAAVNVGMKSFIFIFYRQLAGTVFFLLFAVIFERRSVTHLTLLIFFKISAVGFLGITLAMNLFVIAFLYSISALLASATMNCVPVTTFFFAVLLRFSSSQLFDMYILNPY
ncbi:hypothetical protein NL676_014084 [Syzygium grande]|nr:hypothetical protein NL676_014084 [Syzygium grande]